MMHFSMFYRLNKDCAWQPAFPLGNNLNDAKAALLLAVKTIYRIGSKDIEIVETIGGSSYPPTTVMQYPHEEGYGGYCDI